MNTYTTVILVLFFAVIAGVATFAFTQNQVPRITLSSLELARHNTEQDCWVLVAGKVYDVTTLIPTHPGGKDAIKANCGTDATTVFTTRGDLGPHPSAAQATLETFYIGDFNQTIVATSTSR